MMRDRTPSKMAKTISKTELLPLVDTEMSPEADSASGRKCTSTATDAFPIIKAKRKINHNDKIINETSQEKKRE